MFRREFMQSLISTYTILSQTNFFQSLIKLLGENVYICPSVDFTTFYSNSSEQARVYRYSYDYRSSQASKDPAYGVIHGEEAKIWFAISLDPSLKYQDDEKRFSLQLVKYWTNFVKYGDPNVYDKDFEGERNPIWPYWIELSDLKRNNSYQTYLSLKPHNITATNDSSFLNCDFWRPYSSYPNRSYVFKNMSFFF